MKTNALGCYIHWGNSHAETPVLLFLHGVGECFFNENNPQQIGPKNLFEQGAPKRLADVASDHPVRTSFVVIAPQLPDRATPWINVVDDLKEILARQRSQSQKLYIMGFSKGGLGAFQVGEHLHANAMVTIDASPMGQPAKEAFDQWVRQAPPFWAIHTTYRPEERLRRVQDFNEQLTQRLHESLETAPAPNTQWRTCKPAPSQVDGAGRHVWICDQASTSAAPYRWLLQH